MPLFKTQTFPEGGKLFFINKYWLWLVIILISGFFTIGLKPFTPLLYKKTKGIYHHLGNQTDFINGKRVSRDNYIYRYEVNGQEFFAAEMALDDNRAYEASITVVVLYNPSKPQDGYVYSFMGLFFPGLGFFIAIFVVVSGTLLAKGFLPTYIKLPITLP